MAGFSISRRHCGVRYLILYRWALCLLIIALCSLVDFKAAVGEETALQKRLINAAVLREFDTEGAHVQQAIVAQDVVVFQLWKADSTVIVAYDFNGTQRFRFGLKDAPSRQLGTMEVSEDGTTLVVAKAVGHESMKYQAFDISIGTHLFELNRSAYLRPSPSGKYFCNLYDEISEERPAIYDRAGKEIKRLNEPRHTWNSRFLDDDHLLICDPDTARFLAAGTGDLIKVVPLGLGNYPLAPRIRMSCVDSVIAIYNEHAMLLLSMDGNVLWRDDFDDYLCSVIMASDTPWMALQFEIPKSSDSYLKVMSILNPDKNIESATILAHARYSSPILDVFGFADGVITIWKPPLAIENFLRKDVDYQTLFMEFDPESMTFSQPVTVPGFYRVIANGWNPVKYLRAGPRGTATLLSIEKLDPEVKK